MNLISEHDLLVCAWSHDEDYDETAMRWILRLSCILMRALDFDHTHHVLRVLFCADGKTYINIERIS